MEIWADNDKYIAKHLIYEDESLKKSARKQ